ncbi:hypothetical protein SmJEL517_g02146 [Synchytrium microbalum]|uniref:PCI domain-containing protein n=1 Tax=Synchytrium microbalum TaxID=1806994 RepID=A0A507C1X9_9FUNG|nr:uncharacterized protein SmJEL517_g02146 [Synchytrium microbalum]TPX35530.1 hypothetical protein SmJEL517_g02146 [Synchytrium microbalum]
MDIDRDVVGFLTKQRSTAPAQLRDTFAKLLDLYDKKLWHQLTVALESFLDLPGSGPYLMPLYQEFIIDWEKKMNQLSLVRFTTRAAKQLSDVIRQSLTSIPPPSDPKESLAFLSAQTIKLKEIPDATDAYVLASMEAAHFKLVCGDLDGCQAAIEECEKLLDSLSSTDLTINACFYRVAADYYKLKAAFPQYYHNALLYLSSVNLADLTSDEKVLRAHDLALSALLGEGVYNFGELLMHPILDVLRGTPIEWLRQLLFCFNSGDIDGFDKIIVTPGFRSEPLLVAAIDPANNQLSEKLCLMTLVESVFKKSKESRSRIPFSDISRETRVPVTLVEHLVMKALSLGLIKGQIDEVDQIVEISWVQPRVLDKNQIATIATRLAEWTTNVRARVTGLENEESAMEVFVQ